MSLLRELLALLFRRRPLRPRTAAGAIEAELVRLHVFLAHNPSRTDAVLEAIAPLHAKLIEIAERAPPPPTETPP